MVVSIGPKRLGYVGSVREVIGRYVATHGEAAIWDWNGMMRLGIKGIRNQSRGDVSLIRDGNGVFAKGLSMGSSCFGV